MLLVKDLFLNLYYSTLYYSNAPGVRCLFLDRLHPNDSNIQCGLAVCKLHSTGASLTSFIFYPPLPHPTTVTDLLIELALRVQLIFFSCLRQRLNWSISTQCERTNSKHQMPDAQCHVYIAYECTGAFQYNV